MELRPLEAFLAVADTATFTAAAARLHLSQQSLSRLVAQLERELGVRLFDRTTRSVALTISGRAMLAPPRPPGRRPRPWRSGSTCRPAASTPVRASSTPCGGPTPEVLVHEVEVGVAAEHRLAALDAVPVAELAAEELLLPSADVADEWIRFVEVFCRQAGITPRRWRGITHGSAAAAEAVASGRCVVPTTSWRRAPHGVVFRPLVDPEPIFAWSMISRPGDLGPVRATVRELAGARGWMIQG